MAVIVGAKVVVHRGGAHLRRGSWGPCRSWQQGQEDDAHPGEEEQGIEVLLTQARTEMEARFFAVTAASDPSERHSCSHFRALGDPIVQWLIRARDTSAVPHGHRPSAG